MSHPYNTERSEERCETCRHSEINIYDYPNRPNPRRFVYCTKHPGRTGLNRRCRDYEPDPDKLRAFRARRGETQPDYVCPHCGRVFYGITEGEARHHEERCAYKMSIIHIMAGNVSTDGDGYDNLNNLPISILEGAVKWRRSGGPIDNFIGQLVEHLACPAYEARRIADFLEGVSIYRLVEARNRKHELETREVNITPPSRRGRPRKKVKGTTPKKRGRMRAREKTRSLNWV